MDQEADFRTLERLKSLVNRCDGTHSSVLSILSELRSHVKSSDMLEALKTERIEMLEKVVNWAENSVTIETGSNLSLIEHICLMKAREGKLKAVIKVCDPLFKDITSYHEARRNMEQIVRELTSQVNSLYRKWCSSWLTVDLDSHKPCITIDPQSQVPLVTFQPRLVTLSRECRTLRCLGFKLPDDVVEKERDLVKYGSLARQLEEIVNFYCTIGDSILLCQQPILIDAARSFTALLESRNNTMTWDCDINQLEAWLSELRDFARKFADENRRLHRYHGSLLKSIIKLFDLPLNKWRPLMNEMISVMVTVDNLYSNTNTWKKHWDYQLYKILDYHFNKALISSANWLGFNANPYCGHHSTEVSSLRIDLTFKNGQIIFRPSLEEIQFKLYHRINMFLTTFTQFKGFLESINPDMFQSKGGKAMKNIFSTIYLRNIDNLSCLYQHVDRILSELIMIRQQFNEWTCLFNVIQESHSDDFSLSTVLSLVTLEDYQNNLTLVKQKGKDFNKKFIDNDLTCSTSNITVNLIPIKVSVDWIYSEIDRLLINSLRRETESMSTELNNKLSQLLTQLTSPPDKVKAVIELESFWLDSSSSTIISITSTYNELSERCQFLSKWSAKSIPNLADLNEKYGRFQSLVDNRESLIASFKQLLRSRLETRSGETVKSLESLTQNWKIIKSRGYPNPSQLEELKQQFESVGSDVDNYLEGCKYFNLPVPEAIEMFNSFRVEIIDSHRRLLKAKQFDDGLEPYLDTEWIIVRNKVPLLEDYIESWDKSQANNNDEEADEVIKMRVKEWKSFIAILKLIKGEVFAKSHWDELLTLIDYDSRAIETLKLKNLFDKRETLVTIKNELRALNDRALGEQSVRQTFAELESLAASAKFDLTRYTMDSGQQVSLIKNWRSILNSISESIVTLNSLKGSDFFDHSFTESGSQWETRLTGLNSLINSLNTVQRKWTYLEPIYSRNQGPEIFNDSSFTLASRDFINIMKTIETDCHVVRLLRISGLSERLSSIDQHLASCQKKLNLFMEESRNRFPRFYFLADDDLLLVLAGKTSITESGLLKKLFNNTITKILFDGNNSVAVESPEGEQIRLRSPIAVNFNGGSIEIENWLRNVESEVSKSLKTDLFDCLGKEDNSDELIWSAPSQIVSLFQWIRWTASTEDCIRRSRLKILHNDLARQLTDLITEGFKVTDLVIKIKIRSMVLDIIHFIDVVEQLLAANVSDVEDWRWKKQLRYYADVDRQLVSVSMGLSTVNYSFDYIGCYGSAKLVHTPLTDKCFLVLMQALSMGLGGNPYGPAGTGKTETVKALGHQLGRQVLVFNCDEAIDVKAMTRILIGLIKCGSWGCFDEFNRLQIEVLSSLSTLIHSIQVGFKSTSDLIHLNGPNQCEVKFNRNSGIFVTLNPAGKQYKGRNELPDNLKALFLPVAMTVPDSALIARVLLLSEGFSLSESEPLGQKVTAWFNLAKDSMSYQKHYDWGLRAIKSCLSSCGRLLRSSQSSDYNKKELSTVIQSLGRQVRSKLVDEDQHRFTDLVSDVFGLKDAELNNLKLTSNLDVDVLKQIYNELGLTFDEKQIEGINVLDEQLNSRLGVVILGPSGVGKSAIWRVLMIYKRKAESINVVPVVINPKSMTRVQLLGYIDEETREWQDGVLTKLTRTIARDEGPYRFWLIFDGEIDPDWVEALNSVLDDNHVLTLPSGERIDFDPNKVSLIFETTSLQYASPATISRVGIISLNFSVSSLFIQSTIMSLGLSITVDEVISILDESSDQAFSQVLTACQLLKHSANRSLSPYEALNFLKSETVAIVKPDYTSGSLIVTSSLISTIDLIKILNETRQHMLLIGSKGMGKNLIVHEIVLKSTTSWININCVPTSSPIRLIELIKEICHETQSPGTGNRKLLKPKDGGLIVIYMRNLELIQADSWNCVTLVTFLITLITYKGFHDPDTKDWMVLEDFQLIATINDTKYVDNRFLSVVNCVHLSQLSSHEIESVIQSKIGSQITWASSFSSGFNQLCSKAANLIDSKTIPILSAATRAINSINSYETITNDVLKKESLRSLVNYVPVNFLNALESNCDSIFGTNNSSIIKYPFCSYFGANTSLVESQSFADLIDKSFNSYVSISEAKLPRLALIPEVLDLFSQVSVFLGDSTVGIKGLVLLGPSGSCRKLSCKIMANLYGYETVWSPKFSSEKQLMADFKSTLDSEVESGKGERIVILVDQMHFSLFSLLCEKLSDTLLTYSGSLIVRVILTMNNLASPIDRIWSRACYSIYPVRPWSESSLFDLPKYILSDLGNTETICNQFVQLWNLSPEVKGDCRRYISFILTFEVIRDHKVSQLNNQKERLEKGLGKLEEASTEVAKLQEEAANQQAILASKRSEADAALNMITESMHDSEGQKVELEQIKQQTERESMTLTKRKGEIEIELKEIEPILQSAKAAVGGIKSESLSEIRSLRAPPEVIRDILEGVLRLMGVSDTSWVSMKSFLSRRGVKDEIINFDARKITPEIRARVESSLANKPDSFDERQAKRASIAAAPLANWVKANLAYSKVLHKIKPLEDEQARLQSNLRSAQNRMKALASELNGVEREVGSLRDKLNQVTIEAAQIEVGLNKTNAILSASKELIGELSSEYERWKKQLSDINVSFETLPLKCLIVSAYIHFTGRQESTSVKKSILKTLCSSLGIETFSICDFADVKHDNEVFYAFQTFLLTPVLIDPSRKCLSAIGKAVEIIDTSRSDWLRLVELALRFGKTIVLESISGPSVGLISLLRFDIYGVEGSRCYTYLGDKRVDYNGNFRCYLLTNSIDHNNPNDFTSWSLVNLINMSPSSDTTEANLLRLTITIRRPELEEKKLAADHTSRELLGKLKGLEDQLLITLNSSTGNILDDRELVASLKAIKASAKDIEASLVESNNLTIDIDKERQQYQPLASMGSLLFHSIRDLSNLHPIYSFGINEYESLYSRTLISTKNITDEKLLSSVYSYIGQALFPQDKAIFRRYLESTIPISRHLDENVNPNLRNFLKQCLSTTDCRIVLIITSKGTDPSGEIRESLINEQSAGKQSFYSMGPDVIPTVEKLLISDNRQVQSSSSSSSSLTSFICLSNLHVVLDWLPTLSRLLSSRKANDDQPGSFIVLVTQIHDRIPVSLLELCIKFVYLSSPGLRDSIDNLESEIGSNTMNGRLQQVSRLTYFHSIVCERCNYVPIGWTKFYDFGFNDYRTATNIIDTVKTRKDRSLQLQYIRGIMSSVLYGARLDTQMDFEILSALLRKWFNSSDKINRSSLDEKSDFNLLGLAPNVNRWKVSMFEETVEKGLKILESTSKVKSDKAFSTAESINKLLDMAQNLADIIDNQFNNRNRRRSSIKEDSLIRFFESEKLHLKQLIQTILVNLSEVDSEAYLSTIRGETPDNWLIQWPTGSNEVDKFIQGLNYITNSLINYSHGHNDSPSFNLGSFLHPMAFINAIHQKASRLMDTTIDNIKTFCSWPGVTNNRLNPKESFTITIEGLLLEGALFENGYLRDCNINSDLQSELPPMQLHLTPKALTFEYETEYVVLPVYGSKSREILITWFDVPCKANTQDDWITRGTAILINSHCL
ncbi:cytoplasmic dynein 2 heavy chain 1-like [Tetranychus urticae]|uniref:cytoplasmic dynein 2 heavy chain 1-like n=1 Tax=Tetranychus urticae TaxID=32264 RepID=UPI00077B9F58|nr:cytoplasmic dynein 2 heavy chain 1-like [Tetranychus urticae]